MKEHRFTVRFLNERYPAIYIKTNETARAAIEKLEQTKGIIGLDTETCGKFGKRDDEGLSPILGRVRLLQVFDGECSYLFDLNHVDPSLLTHFLRTHHFVAHNAIFDLGMLQAFGFEVPHMGCTLIAWRLNSHYARAFDGGEWGNLRAVVLKIFKEDVLKVLQTTRWGEENLTFEQIEYAALDAICTRQIVFKVSKSLASRNLLDIYTLYKKAQYPISKMEFNGIGFDVKAHQQVIDHARSTMFEARQEVLNITGLDEITPHKMSDWLRSSLPKEILLTWPKTATGKLSTSSSTFENHSHLEFVQSILKFNEEVKILSSFGTNLVKCVNPVTGRIHPKYNISGARTGRLSATNPNIQQMPHEITFRNLFVAGKGNLIVCADFSQIEVRIAAEMSGDEKMKEVYQKGLDIYKETAATMLKKPVSEVTKDERQCAKAIVLGSQFGLGAKKFSMYARLNYKVQDITEERAEELIQAYRKAYPTFREWQIEQTTKAKKTLKATTRIGKIRALDKEGYYGQALNHPIQGSAAEVMLCSLINFYETQEKTSLLIACVHDEILVEAPEREADKVKVHLEECMVQGFLQVFPEGITNGLVEAKVGRAWGEAK